MVERGQRVDELVTWRVERPPAGARVAGVIQLVVVVLIDLIPAAGGGAGWPSGAVDRPDALRRPRLGAPGDRLDLPPARLGGDAPWMPPSWAGPQVLSCYPDRVTTNPRGLGTTERELDLATWHVEHGRPVRRGARPRAATTGWELALTDGASRAVLTGPWLTLAWIGLLAGWPEPSPPGGDARPHR